MNKNKEKEYNIDNNSKIAISDYNTKKILMNIFYHKIFLGLCIIANIGLFIFIIIYYNKISEIEFLTKSYSSQSKDKNELFNKHQLNIDNKLTNLIAISDKRSLFFSYSFLNESEYNLVKNFILDYHKDLLNIDSKLNLNYQIKMIYQSVSDYFSYVDLVNLLNYRENALLIINTLEDEKFGIFLDEKILFDKNNQFISEGKNIILFSFRNKNMIKYIGDNSGIKINDKSEAIFIVGNDEIIIYNYSYNFGGTINYPLNSFEKTIVKESDFININGNFDIKNIEIFEISF